MPPLASAATSAATMVRMKSLGALGLTVVIAVAALVAAFEKDDTAAIAKLLGGVAYIDTPRNANYVENDTYVGRAAFHDGTVAIQSYVVHRKSLMDERGATAVEYALMVGLIAVAWHRSYEQYAGTQMQHRFERFAKRVGSLQGQALEDTLRLVAAGGPRRDSTSAAIDCTKIMPPARSLICGARASAASCSAS